MKKEKVSFDNKRIVISRTDSIGDVMLTLLLCRWIKKKHPSVQLLFLGRKYTLPILEECDFIDEVYLWEEILQLPVRARSEAIKQWNADIFIHVFPDKEIARAVKQAKIPVRIGTSHRSYHLLSCNYRPNFTRKRSDLHEAQLNFHLLEPFGVSAIPSFEELKNHTFRIAKKIDLPNEIKKYVNTSAKKIILHPKSKGSAREWSTEKYIDLAERLANKGHLVFFTGTAEEGKLFRHLLPKNDKIIDVSGKMNLKEFMGFLSACDAIVACSTGPLHIAAQLGTKAIGLYTPIKPMHPGRWQPIGKEVRILTDDGKNKKELMLSVEEVSSHLNF